MASAKMLCPDCGSVLNDAFICISCQNKVADKAYQDLVKSIVKIIKEFNVIEHEAKKLRAQKIKTKKKKKPI